MADLAEVTDALATLVAGIVYPVGTDAASVAPDAAPVIVYEGWPDASTLEADLAAGKCHVSLFPQPRDTVTYVMLGDTEWEEQVNPGVAGVAGVGARTIRRQMRGIQVTVWAPTPAARDGLAKAIDVGLALTSRFQASDGSVVMLTYGSQNQSDEKQTVMVYRRDLLYSVDYATVQLDTQFTVTKVVANLTGGIIVDTGA